MLRALKDCYQTSICSIKFSIVLDTLSPSRLEEYQLDIREKKTVWIKASDFAEVIKNIQPTATHKYNIESLLVNTRLGGDSNKDGSNFLVGVDELQDRLNVIVLQPFMSNAKQRAMSLPHCSG